MISVSGWISCAPGLCGVGMLFFVTDAELHELVQFECLLESPSFCPCSFYGSGLLDWAFCHDIPGHMFSQELFGITEMARKLTCWGDRRAEKQEQRNRL